MHVKFWGTRGSIAKAGPSTLRFGGNTSCIEVRSDAGTLIVLDCGTGAHGLGQDLLARSTGDPVEGHLLISHTHWDHIQGLPFFAPLFRPDDSWHIYGPRGLGPTLSETLAGQMQFTYFPVTIEQLTAAVDYHDLVEGSFDIGDVKVTTQYLNHPALTLGYRLEADGAVVVYSSDHEPHDRGLAGGGDLAISRQDSAHARFFAGADLLVHDAQYLAEEYPDKVGWGHSTVEYVVDAAHYANVARLALFHHDPSRDDEAVDALVELARARGKASGFGGEVFAAAEETSLELRGAPSENNVGASTPTATARPALDVARSTMLIAVRSPEIAATLRAAAEAEALEIWEASDRDSALDLIIANTPSVVVFEAEIAGDGLAEVAETIRRLDPAYGDDVALVVVAPIGERSPAADDLSITDWLVWPSSAIYVRAKLHAWLLRRACRWKNAPLPPDEGRRLRAVRALGILDTEPERRFDQYTELASTSFDVPIALVSLVDADRQWFKSHHGIEATETPRDMAVCAHAILEDDVLQVPDALDDSRFADNPLVSQDPRVRFYAGVPLTLADGSRAGTLCVLDYRPRVLDEQQLDELRRLGALVTEELERT